MQIEYFDNGTALPLSTILFKQQVKKIFLVSGKQSFFKSGAFSAFTKATKGIETLHFNDFSANPKLTEAIDGIKLLRRFQADIVVAIGGGSVIDMGKLITLLSAQPTDDYCSIIEHSAITETGLPFVAIPTTSGSGSEATRYAVVYIGGIKHSLTHSFVLPNYSIVDPSLTFNSPRNQLAVSGMDALCQAVESYWSRNATPESRELSSQAIKLIFNNICDAVCERSKDALKKMALGANKAGKAINITETTGAHAISYSLTARYSIPHGHAVALILGKLFTIHQSYLDTLAEGPLKTDLANTFNGIYFLLSCSDAGSCSNLWHDLMIKIGLETDMAELGVRTHEDYQFIANSINPTRLRNHPIQLNHSIVGNLFNSSAS